VSSRVQAGVGPGLNTSGVSSPANAATWTSFAGVTSPGARVVTSASHGKIAESQADDDVPSTIERIYDLALRSLDEQERQVGELRGRLAPVVAAGGLGSTLLARSVFARSHPEGCGRCRRPSSDSLAQLCSCSPSPICFARGRWRSASMPRLPWMPAREAGLLDDAGEFDDAMARHSPSVAPATRRSSSGSTWRSRLRRTDCSSSLLD